MADVELDDLRQGGDEPRGLVVEAMAGMAFEPERRGLGGGDPEAAELVVGLGRIAPLPGVAPRPGMELDDRRSQFGAGLQRLAARAR